MSKKAPETEDDSKSRKYEVDGVRVPSVSDILDRVKNKEGLMYWANKIGREQGLTLYEARKKGTGPGTLAHSMVEERIKGKPAPDLTGIDPEIVEKAKKAFDAYLSWEDNTHLTFSKEHIELKLTSKKHLFGGRPDCFGFNRQGQLIILDWKTNDAYYPDMKYQLAAYEVLWEENYPDSPVVGGAHLCRFDKNDSGFSHHHFPDLTEERADFILFRQLYPRLLKLDGKKGGVQ